MTDYENRILEHVWLMTDVGSVTLFHGDVISWAVRRWLPIASGSGGNHVASV